MGSTETIGAFMSRIAKRVEAAATGMFQEGTDWARSYAEDVRELCKRLKVPGEDAVTNKPVPGGVYRHNKTGNKYTVKDVAVYCGKHQSHTSDRMGTWEGFPEGTELVVYVGHYDNPRGNRTYVRPVTEWDEGVEIEVARIPAGVFENKARYERIA